MNYLALAQRTRQECLMSGTGPSTVTSQTGELGRIVDWVASAWNDIQNRSTDWRWMRSTFTVNTVADDDSYAYTDCTDTGTSSAISRFSCWLFSDSADPPKIYLNSDGSGTETWLTWTPWEYWKSIYKIGTQTSGYPAHITVDPQNNIRLGPAPNDVYVVEGDYQKSAQTLSADSDIPEMPSQFHELIYYAAMEKYARAKAKPELLSAALSGKFRLERQLEANQLPGIRLAGPLA